MHNIDDDRHSQQIEDSQLKRAALHFGNRLIEGHCKNVSM